LRFPSVSVSCPIFLPVNYLPPLTFFRQSVPPLVCLSIYKVFRFFECSSCSLFWDPCCILSRSPWSRLPFLFFSFLSLLSWLLVCSISSAFLNQASLRFSPRQAFVFVSGSSEGPPSPWCPPPPRDARYKLLLSCIFFFSDQILVTSSTPPYAPNLPCFPHQTFSWFYWSTPPGPVLIFLSCQSSAPIYFVIPLSTPFLLSHLPNTTCPIFFDPPSAAAKFSGTQKKTLFPVSRFPTPRDIPSFDSPVQLLFTSSVALFRFLFLPLCTLFSNPLSFFS